MALTQATKTELYRFFVIAFDAAPGVTYMSQLAEASEYGMSVQEIVEVFTTKPQFTAVYPNFLTTEQFAAKLVANVVGDSASTEAKAEAEADVAAALNAGWSRGEVIYTIFNNLAAKSFDDPVWGATAEQMANQVKVAQYYTEEMLGNTTDLGVLQSVIAGVNQDTDVSTSEAIEAAIGQTLRPTETLTEGVDNINGTAAVDVIQGGTSTLTLGDYINGGGGNDVLNLTLAGNGGEGGDGLYAGFQVENVETLNVRAIGEDSDVELSLTYVEGLKQINVLRSTNEIYLQDIQNLVGVKLDDVAADVSIDFDKNEDVLGSADALNLEVREVGSSADGYDVDVTIDEDIEILNIEDSGRDNFESDFALYGEGLERIVVTGGAGYTQEEGVQQGHLSMWIGTDGNGASLDSTAYAGDLSVGTTQSDVDDIATGAGDDEIYIDSDWDATQTISTGGGSDSVEVDGSLGGTIDTGSGDDDVDVADGVLDNGLITTGDGDDSVEVQGGIAADGSDAGDEPGQVLLGNGDDKLWVNDGDLAGLVDAGEGDDYVEVNDGQLADGGVVIGGEGADELALWNSFNNGGQNVTDAATVTGVEALTLGNYERDGYYSSGEDNDEDIDHNINLDAFDDALTTIGIENFPVFVGEDSGYYGDADQNVVLTNLTNEAIQITSLDSDNDDDVERRWQQHRRRTQRHHEGRIGRRRHAGRHASRRRRNGSAEVRSCPGR